MKGEQMDAVAYARTNAQRPRSRILYPEGTPLEKGTYRVTSRQCEC